MLNDPENCKYCSGAIEAMMKRRGWKKRLSSGDIVLVKKQDDTLEEREVFDHARLVDFEHSRRWMIPLVKSGVEVPNLTYVNTFLTRIVKLVQVQIDTECQEKPTCPHCGYSWVSDNGLAKCLVCGGSYGIEELVSVAFRTTPVNPKHKG